MRRINILCTIIILGVDVMKNIISKMLIIAGEFLSIIGLFPVAALYPSMIWKIPNAYWEYLFSNRSGSLWKLALTMFQL